MGQQRANSRTGDGDNAEKIKREKEEIRDFISEKMRTLSSEQIQKGADDLFSSIERWFGEGEETELSVAAQKLQHSKYIALFWSMPDEIPTHRWVERWHDAGHRVVLPITDGVDMSFGLYTGELRIGRFGIMEPTGEVVASSEIGYMFVPFVAVDSDNNRLGRGGGFYDRFLAENRHIYKHAIGLNVQLLAKIPVEDGDVAMDLVSLAEV